jgi:hypothetical protein
VVDCHAIVNQLLQWLIFLESKNVHQMASIAIPIAIVDQ